MSAPRAFRRSMTRRSIEGFLFPSRYDFGPVTTAQELIALQLDEFAREWATVDLRRARARGLDPYEVLIVASMIERETVVPAERALVSAVIYNRLDADMPLGDRRDAPLRPRRPRNAAADEGRPREPLAVQHAPVQGAAADADREPRAGVDPGCRAPGEGRLPLLRSEARQAAPLLHGRRRRVLPQGAGVRLRLLTLRR